MTLTPLILTEVEGAAASGTVSRFKTKPIKAAPSFPRFTKAVSMKGATALMIGRSDMSAAVPVTLRKTSTVAGILWCKANRLADSLKALPV